MPRRLLISAIALVGLLLVAAPARADWQWPVTGDVITPYRLGGDPFAAGQHRGIDIAAAQGAPVVAATPGEIRFAGTVGSSGLTIAIRTADGRFDTSYLHLSSASVREGQQVAAGQRVGAVGTTGERSARQPHLHFGVRDAGTAHGYHDPLGFLPPPAGAPQGPRGAPAPHAVPVTAGPGRSPSRGP
ncbi:MAG TPA: M23 family metallopeptidase, partial [Pseudonocardia sp.]|nr:M23 family metallopeptidase [Pseudonocardia sp.]